MSAYDEILDSEAQRILHLRAVCVKNTSSEILESRLVPVATYTGIVSHPRMTCRLCQKHVILGCGRSITLDL